MFAVNHSLDESYEKSPDIQSISEARQRIEIAKFARFDSGASERLISFSNSQGQAVAFKWPGSLDTVDSIIELGHKGLESRWTSEKIESYQEEFEADCIVQASKEKERLIEEFAGALPDSIQSLNLPSYSDLYSYKITVSEESEEE